MHNYIDVSLLLRAYTSYIIKHKLSENSSSLDISYVLCLRSQTAGKEKGGEGDIAFYLMFWLMYSIRFSCKECKDYVDRTVSLLHLRFIINSNKWVRDLQKLLLIHIYFNSHLLVLIRSAKHFYCKDCHYLKKYCAIYSLEIQHFHMMLLSEHVLYHSANS